MMENPSSLIPGHIFGKDQSLTKEMPISLIEKKGEGTFHKLLVNQVQFQLSIF